MPSLPLQITAETRPARTPKRIIRADYQLHRGDCLTELGRVADGSVAIALFDPPYGITEAAWDRPLDLVALWVHLRRVLRPGGVVLIHCQMPFTATLAAAAPKGWLKYDWTWVKNRPTGFVHAAHRPMVGHETILVFSAAKIGRPEYVTDRMPYAPQGLRGLPRPKIERHRASQYRDATMPDRPSHRDRLRILTGYPTSVLHYDTDQDHRHPTAKPVPLLEFLIRTYSAAGDLVLDPTMGSGSTGVAAVRSGRRFHGIERAAPFFRTATERLREAAEGVREGASSSRGGRRLDPIDVILERMEEFGIRARDLEGLLGGSGRVSEILSRRRALTLAHIRVLSEALAISADRLIPSYDLAE